MALFPNELSQEEIKRYCTYIEEQEKASGVTYVETSFAFHHFMGTVENKPIKFSVDRQSNLIITEES